MQHSGEQRRHRFLRAELAVLACLLCFWAVRSGNAAFDGVMRRFYGPGEIQAIAISDSGESTVLIDGELVCEGSIVNGYRIKEVRADEIIFQKNGKVLARTTSQTSAAAASTSDSRKQQLSGFRKDGHKFSRNIYCFFQRHHVLIPTLIYVVIGFFSACVICLRRNHS